MTDIILKAEHLKKVFISGKKSMTAVDDVSFVSNNKISSPSVYGRVRMPWNCR